MNLTEFVVSLSIVSIIAMSGFGVAHRVSHYRVEGAAMRFFSLMNQSRSTAMSMGLHAGLYIAPDPETGNTMVYRVRDGNGNGLRSREIEAGIDHQLGLGMCLEKEFRGVNMELKGFGRGKIISFSPRFKSSTGSIYFRNDDPLDSHIRIKLFGVSTITRPMRVFPDGTEEPL